MKEYPNNLNTENSIENRIEDISGKPIKYIYK